MPAGARPSLHFRAYSVCVCTHFRAMYVYGYGYFNRTHRRLLRIPGHLLAICWAWAWAWGKDWSHGARAERMHLVPLPSLVAGGSRFTRLSSRRVVRTLPPRCKERAEVFLRCSSLCMGLWGRFPATKTSRPSPTASIKLLTSADIFHIPTSPLGGSPPTGCL
ncbi:hypothetical protein SODALDRAFT_207350 [Sodiomyces alkalinus F11]|uniref:Uncharacterized protein n=1 Tax=Sodiomyces alkalinus (strain CBS 110278 / VKM F-3762 / F11) TaxID=1314773 RepID=A0A3N2PR10_SODAK|nr:hypothetical protein SODALDRAFT_207350 [Sodiomyces alkalinus F11]ROT36796.1 hypothetical protein SODALDRAFT_207350 [Sodiomyces alkalinus F11]